MTPALFVQSPQGLKRCRLWKSVPRTKFIGGTGSRATVVAARSVHWDGGGIRESTPALRGVGTRILSGHIERVSNGDQHLSRFRSPARTLRYQSQNGAVYNTGGTRRNYVHSVSFRMATRQHDCPDSLWGGYPDAGKGGLIPPKPFSL